MAKRANPYRTLRDETGQTVVEISSEFEVSRQRWYALEAGVKRPSYELLLRIWDARKTTLRRHGWGLEDLIRHCSECFEG